MHVIAGPNGAGKTTFYETYLTRMTAAEFVNADGLILEAIGEHALTEAQAKQGQALKVAAEAAAKLTRLYAAIESGVMDLSDDSRRSRINELKEVRDSARSDVERVAGRGGARPEVVTAEVVSQFALEARRRLRDEQGGFRRHYVQAMVQRVEVTDEEIRICGTPERLLQARTPPIVGSTAEVRGIVPRWLAIREVLQSAPSSVSAGPAICRWSGSPGCGTRSAADWPTARRPAAAR
jgi:hypothetical protein